MDAVLRERVAQVLYDTYEDDDLTGQGHRWDQLLERVAAWPDSDWEEIRDDFLGMAEALHLAGFIRDDA